MDAVERLLGWRRAFIIYATETGVRSDVGSAYLTGAAEVVPGLDRHVIRLYGGDAMLVGASDFTASRNFTFLALVRAGSGSAYRRIGGRVNGGTEVSLGIDRMGRLQGTVASARGNYRRTLTGSSPIADGQWHAVAIRASAAPFFNGMNLTLIVDGVEERTGTLNPGLFGTTPAYGMVSPVISGRLADGSGDLQGDVAAVLGVDQVWSTETFATLAEDLQGAGGAGFAGWGIPMR